MSEYVIVFTHTSGNVCVCCPTGSLSLSETKAKDTPPDSILIRTSQLPTHNDDFFNCWEISGNSIIVNMTKAKEQTKTRLRAERTPLLAALDVQFQRALEDGTSTTEIVAEKRRLRDITLFVDQATTLNQLRAVKCASTSLEDPIADEPAVFTPLDPETL